MNTTSNTKIATVLLLVFFVALMPPAILLANEATLVAGNALLYVWSAVWGLFGIVVLTWAAWTNAFAITEEQVPPELREREEVVTTTESDREDATTAGGEA